MDLAIVVLPNRDVGSRCGVPGETECGGSLDENKNKNKSLVKYISATNLLAMDRSCNMNASRINALRQSINRHNDNVSRILLTSKESLEKRAQIESAFRVCKETFLELSTAFLDLQVNKMSVSLSSEELKTIVNNTMTEVYTDSLLAP